MTPALHSNIKPSSGEGVVNSQHDSESEPKSEPLVRPLSTYSTLESATKNKQLTQLMADDDPNFPLSVVSPPPSEPNSAPASEPSSPQPQPQPQPVTRAEATTATQAAMAEESSKHAVAGPHSTEQSEIIRNQLDPDLPEVFCESRARIPTTNGTEIFLHVYKNNLDNKEHLAIVFGADIHSRTLFNPRENETEHDRMTRGAYDGKLFPGRNNSHDPNYVPPAQDKEVLCRIHSECYTGETAWSARCDCGEQLDEAARLMAEEGRGVIVYLRQEGRGIGLGEKLKAYNLQDLGADTVQANLMLRHPADGRSFGLATAILLDLGLPKIRLMTNNPDKIVAVEGRNKEIEVVERVPMIPLAWQNKGGFKSEEVDKYLSTKIERMGHLL